MKTKRFPTFVVLFTTLILFCGEESPKAPIVDFEEADVKPTVLKSYEPEYPRDARENGWSGTVIINSLVGIDGLVEDTYIRESSGYLTLDNAALDAAVMWEFTQAEKDGELVRVWVEIPFNFKL